MSLAASAEDDVSPKLVLHLTDGSKVVARRLDRGQQKLKTPFGPISLATDRIAAMAVKHDRRTIVLHLTGGDQISGTSPADAWTFSTLLGELRISTEHLSHLVRVVPGRPNWQAFPRPSVRPYASGQYLHQTVDRAFDGNRSTIWGAGNHPLQWIEADLGGQTSLHHLSLVCSQLPSGRTTHQVWTCDRPLRFGNFGRLSHSFQGHTKHGQLLTILFPHGAAARYLQIRTTQSPSWVGWVEINIRCRWRPRRAEEIAVVAGPHASPSTAKSTAGLTVRYHYDDDSSIAVTPVSETLRVTTEWAGRLIVSIRLLHEIEINDDHQATLWFRSGDRISGKVRLDELRPPQRVKEFQANKRRLVRIRFDASDGRGALRVRSHNGGSRDRGPQ